MGWNDHSPAFEMIEDEMADIINEAYLNGEYISDDDAYWEAQKRVSERLFAR